MKKAAFNILLIFLACAGRSQLPGTSPHMDIVSSKRTDSLRLRIAEMEKRFGYDSLGMFDSRRYSWIGDCYEELGDHQKAMENYRASMTVGEFDYGVAKRRNFGKLASFFLYKKQYDSILYYYDIVERSKPKRVGCTMGWFDVFSEYRYWGMLVLHEKGMTDSAVKVFLPYAFQPWTNNEGTEYSTAHLYDNDYHCQVIYFYSILKAKYSLGQLYRDFATLTDSKNFLAKKNTDYSTCYYSQYFTWHLGKYTHDWYGYEVPCGEFEQNRREKTDEFSELAADHIRNSFLYRYFFEQFFF